MAAIGARVKFYDPAGCIVSDTVTGRTVKKIGYHAYEEVIAAPALLLEKYGWIPESWVLSEG